MFDAHDHLHFADFDRDRDEAVQRAIAAGVTGLVAADYRAASREGLLQLRQRFQGVGIAAGLHPWAVGDVTTDVAAELEALRTLDWTPFCAAGEFGLDWVRAKTEPERTAQVAALRAQLAQARERDLPVVLHCVRAEDEMARWLRADGVPGRGGLCHSFWGSAEQARHFVKLGLHLSIGTAITHAQPARIAAAIRQTGLGRLLVETDAPSRPPRGATAERNEPAYLPCVVEAVALVLGTSTDAVAAATESNARQLFGLRETLALSEP